MSSQYSASVPVVSSSSMFATRHNEGTRPKDSGPLETLQVPRSGKIPIRPLLYPVFISDLRTIEEFF